MAYFHRNNEKGMEGLCCTRNACIFESRHPSNVRWRSGGLWMPSESLAPWVAPAPTAAAPKGTPTRENVDRWPMRRNKVNR